jgi:hypothetical protein
MNKNPNGCDGKRFYSFTHSEDPELVSGWHKKKTGMRVCFVGRVIHLNNPNNPNNPVQLIFPKPTDILKPTDLFVLPETVVYLKTKLNL